MNQPSESRYSSGPKHIADSSGLSAFISDESPDNVPVKTHSTPEQENLEAEGTDEEEPVKGLTRTRGS